MCFITTDSLAARNKRHNVPFIYHLQNADMGQLIMINPAVAVVDPYDSGLKPQDILKLQTKYDMEMIGYLSVGEVDPSRKKIDDGYAFRKSWHKARWITGVPDEAKNNARWGTYRVAYWNVEWQTILKVRIKRLIELGYDGVMFDTVDTFYAYEKVYKNVDPMQEMADLVGNMRQMIREIKPDFKIYINSGMELYHLHYSQTGEPFLDLIDGQLKEDTWYNEHGSAQASWTEHDLRLLKQCLDAGKPVFSIDYFSDRTTVPLPRKMEKYYRIARKFGVIPYAADRDLGMFITYNKDYFENDRHWDSAKKFGYSPDIKKSLPSEVSNDE